MKFTVASLLTLVASVSAAPALQSRAAGKIWDGRIPESTTLAEFDSYSTSRYGAEYVLGQGQKWSTVLQFPNVAGSLFDKQVSAKPLEVTITDQSIFAPGGDVQSGFRRSELMPITNNGEAGDNFAKGVTTVHFSVQADTAKPLNYSHEYQIVFIESADYTHQIFTLKTGTNHGSSLSTSSRTLRLSTSTANGASAQTLHTVPFGVAGSEGWHNYAITNDWNKNTITVYYSRGDAPLTRVVSSRYNNNAGKGVFHIGILKLPTGQSSNVVKQGYQPSGINEGLIYGGIFVEDSSDGTVTLQ
ncbi:hypothetical protein BJ508DRAFT_302605 [Ascobolus immersus RN42]|uniref:Glycoside hydrolase 131 catalytic N-terminal domain-containing protein n=1 Tax=Ascobolus immersus RN42 TaxID=1160509 RepID=A0A3N4IK12_ASCIM|nr:hypothetical protein BJ508DRAFT_302605 [Ascobolus immersus RN42]